VECVPLVDVTYDDRVSNAVLVRLGKVLPDIVAEAVACPEGRVGGRRTSPHERPLVRSLLLSTRATSGLCFA